jgi:hypothetical protein
MQRLLPRAHRYLSLLNFTRAVHDAENVLPPGVVSDVHHVDTKIDNYVEQSQQHKRAPRVHTT